MPMHFRTLRFKVAGAFLLWTAVFQTALVLILPVVREQMIISEFDGQLRQHATEQAAKLIAGEISPEELVTIRPPEGHEGATALFYQFSRDQGTVAASPRLRNAPLNVPLPTDGRPAVATVTQAPAESGAPPVRFRTVTVNATKPGEPPLFLTVAASLQTVDWLGRVVRWVLLAALIPGLLGAAIAGWIVSGLTAARIERIADAVRSISANRLDQRLQVTGDDEVGVMAADLNAMLDRLANTISGMERFMAEVSHELKTPISALLAEAQVMKYTQPTPETAARFILSVEDEMRRLGKLVESFLMLARFEHGRRYLAESTVSVNDVILESVGHSSRLAAQNEVPINLNLYDPGEHGREGLIRGDAELLRIAFDNLIRNAIQFSDRGKPVSVDVTADDRDIHIAVRDRGPGTPPEYIEKIFERFAQAPVQKPGRRGTGLGLSIAKGVVDLHGGTIRAANHPEGGCVFTVSLPLTTPLRRQPLAAADGQRARAPAAGSPIR